MSYGGFGQYGQYASYGASIPTYPSQTPPGGNAPGGTGRTRRRGVAVLAAVLVAAVVGGGVGAAVEHRFDNVQPTATNALNTPPLPRTSSKAPAGSVEQVAQTVRRSVVSIIVSAVNGGDEGTGVILSSDGLILTNNHVVAAAANGGRVTVTFDNGKSATAQIVGRDPTSDLAVIRAQGVSGLQPASLGRSADLAVGQQVVAIGSPLGLSGTVTSGIVSALNRPVRTGDDTDPGSTATVMEAIQTDAAINPGNSGGPLADLSGQVVGINSAIATVGQSAVGGQSGNIGVGFAIPIDQARPIANELIKQGHAEHSQLGVTVSDPQTAGGVGGAVIRSVNPGGAADHAGLKPNDLITKVDDQKIDGADALVAVIRAHQPGDKVTVVYARGGSSHTTTVTLGRE
ncbi:MAG TPA: trypsin-like peptidase domain-containing protein [Mycobacteriales bacterium]|nr:trypsin-like peptidase domain-containing protein [Mycobacteriales bacterium]